VDGVNGTVADISDEFRGRPPLLLVTS
jgi:hypothetical protein